MSYRFDTSELDQLEADLTNNVEVLEADVGQVVERAALNVRRDSRRGIRQQITGTYLPHYPQSITYEMDNARGRYAEAEVGPETGRRQGGMGAGVEFGSAHTGPLPHLFPAFDDESPRLYEHLRRVVGQVLR